MDSVADIINEFVADVLHRPSTASELGWRGKWPTIKQRRVLVDAGYRVPQTRGEAFELIGTFQTWEDRK